MNWQQAAKGPEKTAWLSVWLPGMTGWRDFFSSSESTLVQTRKCLCRFRVHGRWDRWQCPLLAPSVGYPQMVWGCVCACACGTGIVRNELICGSTNVVHPSGTFRPHTHTHTHTHSHNIWGQRTDGAKSGYCRKFLEHKIIPHNSSKNNQDDNCCRSECRRRRAHHNDDREHGIKSLPSLMPNSRNGFTNMYALCESDLCPIPLIYVHSRKYKNIHKTGLCHLRKRFNH